MANTVDLKGVVKHIVDGTLHQHLCRVCLLPLGEVCENIFTKICREDQEFSVAEILETVCQIKFSETETFSVCSNCFLTAFDAYKFYLISRRSEEILNYYIDELERHVHSIEMFNDNSHDTLCITLPELMPFTGYLDLDAQKILHSYLVFKEDLSGKELKLQPKVQIEMKPKELKLEDDQLIVVIEDGKRTFYQLNEDCALEEVIKNNNCTKIVTPDNKCSPGKNRKKRDPMILRKCSQCPVRYRFIAKLKSHMKIDHGIDLFVCKICKATMEDEEEFDRHIKSHTDTHCCNICNMVFKKRDSIIAHLKSHEILNKLDAVHVCEICGVILMDEDQLKDHYEKKHIKKYTCFYCGRMYKGEISFEMHIKKHETHLKAGQKRRNPNTKEDSKEGIKKRSVCGTCGKDFVDERSLMWHSMLHTNERPYTCDVCGRGFVSLNRRNQHTLCAHSEPNKRCPLCPALFHLRSMVNTHIKKVHLRTHKRRNRASKHQNVCWRTEAVPIQELSVSIQNEIIELQTKQNGHPLTSPTIDDPLFDWGQME